MSGLATRCPYCATVFRVTQQQLQAHQGQVRCGRCSKVFDAFAELTALPQSAPLPLGLDADAAAETEEAAVVAAMLEIQDPSTTHSVSLPPNNLLLDYAPAPSELDSRPRRWLWASGSWLLLLTLAAQGAYFFRSELAASYPLLKPALFSACQALHCSIELPRHPQQLNIEASDLQAADPARPNLILLAASVRNRAAVAVGYPAVELTLTDAQDRTVARRVFLPADYLEQGADPASGLAANGEVNLKLRLDTGELVAAGYRLYLFYP